MSAEGMPQAEPSYLARPLSWATRLAVRFPWFVIVAALIVAVFSVAFAARFMKFRASRLDLLNPSSHYNKRWLAYLDEFGEDDDVVIVVEADDPSLVVPTVETIAKEVLREPSLFHAVFFKNDLEKIRAKGLHFVDIEQLRRIESFVAQAEPILQGNWSLLDVEKQTQLVNYRLSSGQAAGTNATANEPMADASRLALRLTSALADTPVYVSPWPEAHSEPSELSHLNSQYLLSRDGQLGFILLRIKQSDDQLAPGTEGIDRLRWIIERVQDSSSDVRIGLTGMPILENDEMRTSQDDMVRASILSLVGVACLFIAGFGGLRHPIMTVTALIIAIAWSFGYITLAVGHLNILSVSFGVILIGLGIDFGIHYVARYLQLRKSIAESDNALIQTATSVGPGIITGGITTALAFSTAALTDFTGVAELGIIAGGGILLCIVAAIVVLPAMIFLSDKDTSMEDIPGPIPIDNVLRFVLRLPQFVLVVCLSLTAVVACGAFWLRYDHNLLNMQPTHLESVQWERRLIEKSDRSVWFGLAMADSPEELFALKSKFEQLDTVAGTHEVASLIATSSAEKNEIIERIARRISHLPEQSPIIPVSPPDKLDQALIGAENLLASSGSGQLVAASFGDLRSQLRSLSRRDYYGRISNYQQAVSVELLQRLRALRDVSDAAPPQISDLPNSLRTRFVGKSDRFLLKVYARGDIWDMDQLQRFVRELESVDQRITGHPIQTFYASRQMQESYVHAAIYSLILVMIVLMLDFRSVRLVLLALLPMGLGVLQMFGILGMLDIPLNPANMIVLPLILGIGIDDGVHVVHDYRRQAGRYELSRSTATAVLITSATTMVGFGTMMLANHQGLRSLGQVLTIGVFCCLGTSIVILPALLVLITNNRHEVPATPANTERAAGIWDVEEAADDHEPTILTPTTRIDSSRSVNSAEQHARRRRRTAA